MRKVLLTFGATVVAVAVLTWAGRALDPQGAGFAFVVVWVPMTWLGTVSRVITVRLPASYHRLRPFERGGRPYELVGVRLVKRLLRRGPIAAFNPGLHLPTEPTPERIGQLDQRMRDAEASHMVLFVLTIGLAVGAAVLGWPVALGWVVAFDVALNGYPVMLQRYNRMLLHQRYPSAPEERSSPRHQARRHGYDPGAHVTREDHGMHQHHGPLRVAIAFPDPPFDVDGSPPSGFDLDLVGALAAALGTTVELHRYEGDDFEGIFAGLGTSVDLVASGATITDHRRTLAQWCDPVVRSGQSLVVNVEATPEVRSVDDLAGLVIGVQHGNTSEPIASDLHRREKAAGVARYPYRGILDALGDLEEGRIGAFMKLEPVMRSLTAERPSLGVVQTGITQELIGVAVALDDADLAHAVNRAQRALADDGALTALGQRWFAGSDPEATGVIT